MIVGWPLPSPAPLRPLPRVMRCAHHHCRTSLTEDDAVYCPHGLAFCAAELWEEACHECAEATA